MSKYIKIFPSICSFTTYDFELAIIGVQTTCKSIRGAEHATWIGRVPYSISVRQAFVSCFMMARILSTGTFGDEQARWRDVIGK